MPAVLKKPLPPKPGLAPQPIRKEYQAAGGVKANSIVIKLDDGTILTAEGNHAADVYNWLMDCERYCASNPGTVSPYLGPSIRRLDEKGNEISLRRS